MFRGGMENEMADIKNSALLEKILEYAKRLGTGGDDADLPVTGMTAERYIVAVIDTVTGEAGIRSAVREKKALSDILSAHYVFSAPDFKNVRAYMAKCIDENGKRNDAFADGIYMQRRVYKASEAAKERGADCLTADELLSCILNDPNEYIKAFAEKEAEEEEKKIGEVIDGTESLLESIGEQLDKILEDSPSEFGDHDDADDADDADGESADADETGHAAHQSSAEKKDAVAKLTGSVKSIYDRLSGEIYGQDNAIRVFTTGYFQSELLAMTDKNRKRPRATFLFAGPPGVGKTFLAEKAAEALERPFMRFDMSEYSYRESNIEFAGSDNVYRNSKEGNVTSFVNRNPDCVILFDEIEKAHINVIHLFLQILDAGRLRDNFTDEEVSFTDTILIFTTNVGKQLYEDTDVTDFSGVTRKVILKALQNDVDPKSGIAYFPAAICSRFASGNVVMFNHITAHSLCEIAKREVLRHASDLEREIGISVEVDEGVYPALLFAEGGAADARTVRSRAEAFFNDELFELFRLLDSEKVETGIQDLEKIRISLELPTENKELCELFENEETYEVLVTSSEQVYDMCVRNAPSARFVYAKDINAAKNALRDRDPGFVLLDPSYGISGEIRYLNIEDTESEARKLFRYVREVRPDMPICLLQTPEFELGAEARLSYIRQGVMGVITLTDGGDGFADEIRTVNEKLHQQKSMEALAKANKLVTFETAQAVTDGGKTAEIKLFDFEMTVAVDAEDSKNILSVVSKPNVRFDDVIGAEDAKRELKYFVEYLKNPKKYMGTGVSAPKGVLLYGPPGTGKTMLAKAMASESGMTFITAEGNQFLKKYVGEGPDKVHELFRTARKYAPSVLFVDEIDAIAKERRGGDNSDGAEATLTAFLTEMDGFRKDAAKPVFVLAATNFDVEPGGKKSLDQAFLRRFDRRVYIDLPTRGERIRYIRMKLSEKPAFEVSEDKIRNIAVRSTGMSLAELESVLELALRAAIRDGSFKVTDAIFDEAFETFNGGETKKWDPSQLERVARHEAGHAFICWQSGEVPSYITVVARGSHGGYMQHGDGEDKNIYTKDELLSSIRTALGGRAAEIVYYGERDGISTGASGDLAAATQTARQIICTYGMDEDFGLAVIDGQAARTGELSSKVCDGVNAILSEEMKNAVRLIEENRPAVDALVERLLAENHLSAEAVKEIFQNSVS